MSITASSFCFDGNMTFEMLSLLISVLQSCSLNFAYEVAMCYEQQKDHNLLSWQILWMTLWPFSIKYEWQKVTIIGVSHLI